MNRDAKRFGWGVVAVILVYDGMTHAATGKIWGRLKGDGLPAVAEGWPVIALGLLEVGIGVYLAYRLLSRK